MSGLCKGLEVFFLGLIHCGLVLIFIVLGLSLIILRGFRDGWQFESQDGNYRGKAPSCGPWRSICSARESQCSSSIKSEGVPCL
ncbi:hypothetical protein D3C76_751750 [compost metagenome]